MNEKTVRGYIIELLHKALIEAFPALSETCAVFHISLERPATFAHGDYSTNIALVYAKQVGLPPRAVAHRIVPLLLRDLATNETEAPNGDIAKIEVAGPGFINFHLTPTYFQKAIKEIISGVNGSGAARGLTYGNNDTLAGKKVIVEYTDPNTFKVFHIGHLMANSIGESISRLIDASGADLIRMCYPSDIGLHIAKAVWAISKKIAADPNSFPSETSPIQERTAFLGAAYVEGTQAYEKAEEAIKAGDITSETAAVKNEIDEINTALFAKSNTALNDIYEKGRRWSLEHFETLYKILGTKFDDYIFESEVGQAGASLVREFAQPTIPGGPVFHESEGALIFRGEDHGLHTRVFINSKGLPTYEAKEIGLNNEKFRRYPNLDHSIVITANEQNDYFRVLLRALSEMDTRRGTSIAAKTTHIGHGLLRLASDTAAGGSVKMSSRKGGVIMGEALIEEVKVRVREKIADRGFDEETATKIVDIVAIGAIKYSILRSAAGSDIVFDFEKSLSFEGDSGPYIQYTHTRALSILEKAKQVGIEAGISVGVHSGVEAENSAATADLEKLLTRFPEIVARAAAEYAPHYVTMYVTELASAFNSFYASGLIADLHNPQAPYRVALTQATVIVLERGLSILGIKVPGKM